MGTNLLGLGALVALDAGLCQLAVSLKSVREGVFQRASLGVACTVHINPMFGIVGRDQRKDGLELEYQKE